MKILVVTAEFVPFIKVGGLSEVAQALSLGFRKRGHEVEVVLPLYKQVVKNAREVGVKIKRENMTLRVDLQGKTYEIGLLSADFHSIRVYFIDYPDFYDREYPYGTEEGDYPDNDLRFGLLGFAALELARRNPPDILHVHDWQGSIAIVGLIGKEPYRSVGSLSRVKKVITIHNLGYQGLFPKDSIYRLGLDPSLFHIEGLEFYGKTNFLKGGIVWSDLITTVSPNYAKEIQAEEYGFGLDGVLRKYSSKLRGILNGIDLDYWNPEKDTLLATRYSKNDLSGKRENKKRLLRSLKLRGGMRPPILAFISRLVEQKGLDILIDAIPDLVREGFRLVFLGQGNLKYEEKLKEMELRFPDKVRVKIEFNEKLAHKIYAGQDFYILPSKFEPCGLGPMIAMRYGSVPIVRKTGGLTDTVKDLMEDGINGNGFVFEHYTKDALLGAAMRAISAYRKEELWCSIVKKNMEMDFSWDKRVEEYLELFGEVFKKENVLKGSLA